MTFWKFLTSHERCLIYLGSYFTSYFLGIKYIIFLICVKYNDWKAGKQKAVSECLSTLNAAKIEFHASDIKSNNCSFLSSFTLLGKFSPSLHSNLSLFFSYFSLLWKYALSFHCYYITVWSFLNKSNTFKFKKVFHPIW